MKFPRPGEIFRIDGPPIFDRKEMGRAIDAREKWRLTEYTYDPYAHWDGEEPEKIGNVKYHEIKSYGGDWITISAECAQHAFEHLEHGLDTMFWIYRQLGDGYHYQFRGCALFSEFVELLQDGIDLSFKLSPDRLHRFYLDLSNESSTEL